VNGYTICWGWQVSCVTFLEISNHSSIHAFFHLLRCGFSPPCVGRQAFVANLSDGPTRVLTLDVILSDWPFCRQAGAGRSEESPQVNVNSFVRFFSRSLRSLLQNDGCFWICSESANGQRLIANGLNIRHSMFDILSPLLRVTVFFETTPSLLSKTLKTLFLN